MTVDWIPHNAVNALHVRFKEKRTSGRLRLGWIDNINEDKKSTQRRSQSSYGQREMS